MATTPAPKAGPLVQEDTPNTNQEISRVAEARDDHAPPKKRQRRSINRGEQKNGECEHDKNAAAPAAAPFLCQKLHHLCRK
jgi:hypothetical protein